MGETTFTSVRLVGSVSAGDQDNIVLNEAHKITLPYNFIRIERPDRHIRHWDMDAICPLQNVKESPVVARLDRRADFPGNTIPISLELYLAHIVANLFRHHPIALPYPACCCGRLLRISMPNRSSFSGSLSMRSSVT